MPASPSKKIGINAELNVERMKELEEQLNDQARNYLAELRALNSRLAAYIADNNKRIQDLNSKLASERGSAASFIQERKEILHLYNPEK